MYLTGCDRYLKAIFLVYPVDDMGMFYRIYVNNTDM